MNLDCSFSNVALGCITVRVTEDIMDKIRKSAISPQDAEAVLKDIVVRLGGAVGDLTDMAAFAATDQSKSMGENKKFKKKR